MAIAVSVVDFRYNPNDPVQQIVLWGNGKIDSYGGAPIVTGNASWFTRTDQPVAVAIHISDWATGAGYTLDKYGGVHEFNGAPDVGGGGLLSGVPYTNGTAIRYKDWAWNTNGTQSGYVMDHYGKIYPFGGATPPLFSGARWTWAAAQKLRVQFSPSLRAMIMDVWGGLHTELGSTMNATGAYWQGWNAARDFAVTAWNPLAGYKLDLYGGIHAVNVTKPSGYPYRKGADVGRRLEVVSASNPVRFLDVWSQGQVYDIYSSTPPTVVAGAGTSEIQTVTITGSPTGGTFTLTYSGQTTTALSRTITAGALQTALEALSNIGVGDVVVTGGPANTAALTVTFAGALANTDVSQMTGAHTFTGGSSPGVSIATAVAGVVASPPASVTTTTRPILPWSYSDAQGDRQTEVQLLVFTQAFVNANTMTDPLAKRSGALFYFSTMDPDQRGVTPDIDLPNAAYRFYVRARDSANQWSAWSNKGWTQAITPPATPTSFSATVDTTPGKWRVLLSVNSATGGTADTVLFVWSIDGTTWYPVRSASAVPLLATTTAADEDPPLGTAIIYKAYTYNDNPRVLSLASGTGTVTVNPPRHVLTTTANNALGGEILVTGAPTWERELVTDVLKPVGDPYNIVITDGTPRAREFPAQILVNSRAEWDKLDALIMGNAAAGGTLVWRDPFGDVIYCKPVGRWGRTQKRRLPYVGETTPLGHKHNVELNLVEVRPPYLINNATRDAPTDDD